MGTGPRRRRSEPGWEHWSLVAGFLARRTGDSHLAEDLAQETFYRATRAFLGWRGESPAAWLLSIARNVLIDEHRRRRFVLIEALDETATEDFEPGVELRDAVARLPEQSARLLDLLYEQGFTAIEVAAMSGTSPGAVRTAAYRARGELERLLRSDDASD